MDNIKIPDILTDLSHVGTAGLPLGGVPATAKELEVCRDWGYRIEIENDRAFLRFDEEQIVPYWIQRETPDQAWEGLRVQGFLRIDSTNREALDQARIGAPSGTLVCAEEQTRGRGRNGRDWFSPAKNGLFFSLIVRPGQPSRLWPLLTHAASVALVRTLLDLVDKKVIPNPLVADIKWPNDVLISGKKCAGILLETLNEGSNPAVIVGVGINIHRGSIPDELADRAVCIDEPAGVVVPRRKVLVGFLQQFQSEYNNFEKGNPVEVLDRWKGYSSMWNGVRIWIEEGGRRRSATTRGLDEIGALIIENEDNSRETIHAGDVRIQREPFKG
jgi:BirA family biotin operon repressor/biotin-[acetyl-CoA-carboxylase] ligase